MERTTRLRELFEQALALPADARAAFLDAQCADAALRAELERMLASLSRRFGMVRVIRVLISEHIDTPTLIGWLKPVVLIPTAVALGFPRQQVELILAHPTGIAEIYVGEVTGTRVELRTDVVTRTETAKEYTAGHRLYGLIGEDLGYAYDMAAMGQSLQSHLSAQLKRVA